jgi:hypothetical protein
MEIWPRDISKAEVLWPHSEETLGSDLIGK